jgi:hypothetical protein
VFAVTFFVIERSRQRLLLPVGEESHVLEHSEPSTVEVSN